ncbi:MAG TPA: hypothetical protein VGH74_00230, partial [Planctomycetaceae bacterium]
MRDQEMIVMVDGDHSPDRDFIFGANLARLLEIGTVRCVALESKIGRPELQVVLPGGSGEQTFSTGGCGVLAFDSSRTRLDAAQEWASRVKDFRRAARSLGVSFGGYERARLDRETVADGFASRRVVLAAAAIRAGSIEKVPIGRQLIAPGASRIVFCPARPVAYQRIIVDASDPRLSELLHWGFDWSRRMNAPLYLMAAEPAKGRRVCRIPWLTHVFHWLGLDARIRPNPRCLTMLRHELKPGDLLLTSMSGSPADPIACFGCRLSEALANFRCAVGVLPLERR